MSRIDALDTDQYTSATRLFGAMLNWFSVSAMTFEKGGLRRCSSVPSLASASSSPIPSGTNASSRSPTASRIMSRI